MCLFVFFSGKLVTRYFCTHYFARRLSVSSVCEVERNLPSVDWNIIFALQSWNLDCTRISR